VDFQAVGKMDKSRRHYKENHVPRGKTHGFFFPIENKKVTRKIFLISNDLETSESRFLRRFSQFTKNYFRLQRYKRLLVEKIYKLILSNDLGCLTNNFRKK
jgi:hypothetical protein